MNNFPGKNFSPFTSKAGHPFFFLLFLLPALVARVSMQLYMFKMGTDRSLQLVCARNFMAGKGFTINMVTPSDLTTEIYQPLVGWPPGYPALVGILSLPLQQDVVSAAILFDILSVVLLLLSTRKILQLAGGSDLVVNLYTLVAGFFIYDFMESSTSDLNAIAFFAFAICLAIEFTGNSKRGNAFAAIIGLVCFLPACLKYMFFPVALLLPLYLLWLGKKTNDKRIFSGALTALLTSGLLLTSLIIYQQTNTGSFAYVYPNKTGFFPGNLLDFYPAAIASIINIDTYYSWGVFLKLVKYGQYQTIIWLLNIVALVILMFLFIKKYIRKKMIYWNRYDHLIVLGSLSSMIITGMLMMLSLYYAPIIFPDHNWTYVHEARYFGWVVIFLQILAFILIYKRWNYLSGKDLKMLGIAIAFFLSIEVVHGMYFTFKALSSPEIISGNNKTFVQQKDFIEQLHANLSGIYPGHDIVFASSDGTFASLASLQGAKALYGLPNDLTFSTRPYMMILMIKEHEKKDQEPLLKKPGVKFLRTIGSLHFYEYRPGI